MSFEVLFEQPAAAKFHIDHNYEAIGKAWVCEAVTRWLSHLAISCDASVRQEGEVVKSGFAVVARLPRSEDDGYHTQSWSSGSEDKVLQVELFAIQKAVEFARALAISQRISRKVDRATILSDCQAALLTIRDFHRQLKPAQKEFPYQRQLWTLKKDLQALADDGVKVDFRWSPGHSGIPGNEKADKLAGRAAKGDFDLVYVLPDDQMLETYWSRNPIESYVPTVLTKKFKFFDIPKVTSKAVKITKKAEALSKVASGRVDKNKDKKTKALEAPRMTRSQKRAKLKRMSHGIQAGLIDQVKSPPSKVGNGEEKVLFPYDRTDETLQFVAHRYQDVKKDGIELIDLTRDDSEDDLKGKKNDSRQSAVENPLLACVDNWLDEQRESLRSEN